RRHRASVYEAGCRGSTPRRETNLPRMAERAPSERAMAFHIPPLGKENAIIVLKRLFGSGRTPAVNTKNEAGGRAYAFSPEHALAQYAVTGTMHNTFYATAGEQLEKILSLAEKVLPEFVAKTAVYTRERGFMKDVPALLVAYLAKKDVGLMKADVLL